MPCDIRFHKGTRFYELHLVHDLFDWTVVTVNGRINSPRGRIKVSAFTSKADAQTALLNKHEWSGGKIKEKDIAKVPPKDRVLNRSTQDKVINAWRTIQQDLAKAGDFDTAKRITQFCQTRFGRYLEAQREIKTVDDRTR